MQQRRWPRRSWEAGLTTSTAYYRVSAKISCDVCNVSRMQRHGSSLVQGNTIVSLLCFVIFTGYFCDKGNLQDRHFDVLVSERIGTPYFATDCIAISSMPGRRQLRSAAAGQLYIPRAKTMTFGPMSFKVSGPTICMVVVRHISVDPASPFLKSGREPTFVLRHVDTSPHLEPGHVASGQEASVSPDRLCGTPCPKTLQI